MIEQHSGLTKKRLLRGYSSQRINLGDKARRLPTIKKVISSSTPDVAQAVTACSHPAPGLRVAEAAKPTENTQSDLNIAFMNELAIIFIKMVTGN